MDLKCWFHWWNDHIRSSLSGLCNDSSIRGCSSYNMSSLSFIIQSGLFSILYLHRQQGLLELLLNIQLLNLFWAYWNQVTSHQWIQQYHYNWANETFCHFQSINWSSKLFSDICIFAIIYLYYYKIGLLCKSYIGNFKTANTDGFQYSQLFISCINLLLSNGY